MPDAKEAQPNSSLWAVPATARDAGGVLEVEVSRGKGTTFRLHFPALATSSKPEPGPKAEVHETILLVEDQALVRRLANESLGARGYRVLEAGDADDALRIAERHRGTIHLVITDVVMPGCSGGTLVQRLTEARPEIKALYISGHADMSRHGELRPFLAKPFTPGLLAAKVRDVLDGAV